MTSKTQNYLKWTPSVLVAFFMTFSAVMKFVHEPHLLALYARIGMENHIALFGFAELVFICLFLYRRTMKIGFCLLTAYYGGAMAVELSLGNAFFFPAVILTTIWIAAYLRDASFFKQPTVRRKVTLQ